MANPHVLASGDERSAPLPVRKIGVVDLKDALAKGLADFQEMPTHAIFLCFIYPVVGLLLVWVTLDDGALTPLLYPLATGFVLIGPIAAIGLYELSRRREEGLQPSWKHAFEVLRSRSFVSVMELGLILVAIFLAWLVTAQLLYMVTLGGQADLSAASLEALFWQVLTTPAGWALLIVGNLVGLLFAIVVMTISVVSFPLLLDRDVSVPAAIRTSIRAVAANARTMALWGLFVAAALFVGSLPFFVGLAVVMPILGHATWHLYRKLVR